MSFISIFLTEITDTDEINNEEINKNMFNLIKNEINDYLAGQEKEIDDVIGNTSLAYNNQLIFFIMNILKNKQRTPTKRMYSKNLSKLGSLPSPTSIRFLSKETIAERVKLNPQKNNRNRIKSINSKQTINYTFSIISANESWKQIKKWNQTNTVFFVSHKITKNFNQVNQFMIIMEENMIVIRDPKTFYFYFDWPKDVIENLQHDIEYIIKSYESLAENKIENDTEQL